MEFLDLHKLTDVNLLKSGVLLIAQPFLADSVFTRSVILLCEHSDEGSLGFVLNKPTDLNLEDLLPDIHAPELIVKQGGPVQLDTLHLLHRMEAALGGTKVNEGVFWGGSFEILQELIHNKTLDNPDNIRLFLGYSGWSPGQLEGELKEGSWLITDPTPDLLFDTHPDKLWEKAIYDLGNDYRYLLNLPKDPQLN